METVNAAAAQAPHSRSTPAASAAAVFLAPVMADARDRIISVACTPAYPGLKSWEIAVEDGP